VSTIFYLIRHGRYEAENPEELCPLSAEGVRQAYECAEDERLKNCQLIMSSPFTRAMHTAAIFTRRLGLDVEVAPDLREKGRLESWAQVRRRALAALQKYTAYDKVIVVTHADTIYALTGEASIPNCSIHEFAVDGER